MKRISWWMAVALTACLFGAAATRAGAQVRPIPAEAPGAVLDDDSGASFDDDGMLAADDDDADGPLALRGGAGRGRDGARMVRPRFAGGFARPMGALRALDLTDTQRQRLMDIRERQARVRIQAGADLRLAGLDLRKLMRAETPDKRAIDTQIDRISAMRANLQKSAVGARLEARAVLTPEQRKRLRESMWGGEGQGRGMRGERRGARPNNPDDSGSE